VVAAVVGLTLLVCCGLPALIYWATPVGPPTQAAGTVGVSVAPGDRVRLEGEGGPDVWLAADRDRLEEVQRRVRGKDEIGLRQMADAGDVFDVPQGTRAEVVDASPSAIKVRIKEGKHEGKTGFVPPEWVEE
jgi:hypothetical protein